MTLDRILQAAKNSMTTGHNAHHEPHCYHLPVDRTVIFGGNNYQLQLARDVQSEIENMSFASGYAEPGYTDPDKCVLFANWNVFPRNFDRVLESAGYAVEWSDEWATCEDCNKAVRTSGNSYHWQPSYVLIDDCSIVCLDCLDWADYLESIEDNANVACMASCNPADYGYELLSDKDEYENGFFAGQDDKPADILKALQAKGYEHIVFRLSETSQFYCRFEVWQKSNVDETAEDM